MARIITVQPPSPSSDSERIYACQHCPKRYARKDYLERHELNHTRPGSVCPACGKGFARPDVLRKHLSTSCKSRRGSDGDAPAPLTTAEEDALVPRKRRRPQRRATVNGDSESMSPTSSEEGRPRRPPPRLSYSYDEAEAYDFSTAPLSASSSSSGTGPAVARFPGRSELDAHASFVPSLRMQQQMPQLSPTRFETGRPSDPSPDGPARIGASLEVPLAPAYAGTPENLDPLDPLPMSFQPSAKDTAQDWHVPPPNMSTSHPTIKLELPELPAYPMMPISPTLESPVVDVSGVDHLVSPTVCAPHYAHSVNSWNPPQEGNNMDDLFSWLFTMANTSGPRIRA